MKSLDYLFKPIVSGFRWNTMQGEVLYLHEMETSHIFNSMKMIFNHVAEVYGGETVWFIKKYYNYIEKAKEEPERLVKLVALFCWEIERRGDLPDKYRTPYENIVRQLLGNKLMNQAMLEGEFEVNRSVVKDMSIEEIFGIREIFIPNSDCDFGEDEDFDDFNDLYE